MDENQTKTAYNYEFMTTTAEVVSPDDFIVEFYLKKDQNENEERPSYKIKNLDELMDLMEKSLW